MKILYSLGIWSYRQGVRAAATFGNKKARLLNDGLNATFSKLKNAVNPADNNIWIHAASLGEFEQGRPLMERLRREHPEMRIVLTFFSPSGYEVRRNFTGADVVSYLPFDTPRNVGRFLDIVNPQKAIFIKYEFWINYLDALSRRHVDTYLISGIFRPGQLFFKPWGGFYRRALHRFKTLYIQDHGSRRLLEEIGIQNSIVAGDTRFDRVTDIMRTVRPIPALEHFCGPANRSLRDASRHYPLIFMAGSSWPEDEAVYAPWLRDEKSVKAVIAPHEFDPTRLRKMIDLFGKEDTILLSEVGENYEKLQGKRILIIDCFGLLSSAYAYADIAYVGGAFGAGLHNINEAAVYGVPVIYGPRHAKFIEAQEMLTLGGGISIDSEAGLRRIATRLTHDPTDRQRRGRWAAEYIQSKLGATPRIYADLFPVTPQ